MGLVQQIPNRKIQKKSNYDTESSKEDSEATEIDWLYLWSTAIYDFGLTDEQFWDLSPGQFYALGKRHKVSAQQDDYRFGVIASILATVNSKNKKYNPEDFFPLLKEVTTKNKRQHQGMTAKEMRKYFETHFGKKEDK